MNIDFKGKRVLVTGATRGIGRKIAEDLAEAGAELILTGTNEDEIKKLNLSGGPNMKYYRVDFTDTGSVEGFLKELGKFDRIDVCINNAGINKIDLIDEVEDKDWDDIIAVNLKGPFLLTRAVSGIMKKNGYGRIVNIASIFGVVSKEKRSTYSTTKFGLRGMTKAASNELAGYGVLVNAVSPGFVLTDLTRSILSEKEMKEIAQRVPAKRLAQPEDISKVVLFLASDLNTYLTGKNIVVDGGFIDV